MTAAARLTEHFGLAELAYRRRGQLYLPDDVALGALRRTCELVLEPLRTAANADLGLPPGHPDEVGIHVVPGGGYDPLRDETGRWISHRKSATTQHHHGGAVDIRVGARSSLTPWADGWGLERTAQWIESQLAALGIPGGLGVYRTIGNRFIHIDLRPRRARWTG